MAVVLAGGASRRMGRDKATLPLHGETLLLAAIRKLRRAGFTVAVSGERAAEAIDDAECLTDRFPGCGPLAGVEAGLRAASESPVLFLAVDMPNVPEQFLTALWERAESSGAQATIPVESGYPQPLCAVYSPSLHLDLLAALEQGERRVMPTIAHCAGECGVDRFCIEALAAARGWTGAHRWFQNVNTPEEYGHLRQRMLLSS